MSEELDRCCRAWGLTQARKIAETRTSRVYQVQCDPGMAVLKILTAAGREAEGASAAFLRAMAGEGMVRLLEASDSALLLENLPGPKLSVLVGEGGDAEAHTIITRILGAIHSRPAPPDLRVPHLRERFHSLFQEGQRERPGSLIAQAARVAEELLAQERPPALLHGDIHHDNILRAADGEWRAIDPQPLIGERTYDVANAFYNPDDCPEVVESRSRIQGMAEVFAQQMGMEPRRVLQFALAHGGLSIAWQFEAGEDPRRRVRIAQTILEMLGEEA